MAQLNSDRDFVVKRTLKEMERQKRAAKWHRAEIPLLKELHIAGFPVESVWDLVNTSASYLEALPILLKHLQRSYPAPVREGIARALAVPEAIFGWDVLTQLYRDEKEGRVKSGLAAAIAAISNNDTTVDVVALARDICHGSSRLLLLSALARSNDPRAHETLLYLRDDPELAKEVQIILHRFK